MLTIMISSRESTWPASTCLLAAADIVIRGDRSIWAPDEIRLARSARTAPI
jgi:hypothetical protein